MDDTTGLRLPTATEENIKYGKELNKDVVAIHGENYTEIPTWIGQDYPLISELTLMNCGLTTISNITKFSKLVILVLDNNNIGDENEFGFIPTLETFWANNNKITRLEKIISQILKYFPCVSYVSMLKNPCCPNYWVGKSSSDYKKYRDMVIGNIPTLKFLDSATITPSERNTALLYQSKIARLAPKDYRPKPILPTKETGDGSDEKGIDKIVTNSATSGVETGVSRYVYVGKHSEGNRFIRDKSL